MLPRPLIIASMVGATVGVPYLASRSPSDAQPAASIAATAAAAPEPAVTLLPPVAAESAATKVSAPAALVPGNTTTQSQRLFAMEQVLRFDVTKEWVYRNWDRTTTGPTDVGLFSVRVPLVTGTHPGALAGSLTYFFNSHGQVEHVSFYGRTGDVAQLVSFLVRTYAFQRAGAAAGEQLYQVTRRGRVQSELRTRPEGVIKSDAPHSSHVVELELARPGTRRFLPPRPSQLVIPPASVTASPPAPTDSAAGESAIDRYFNKVRPATPQERDHVLWKRWPN
jgi:hypothetical protein